MPDDVQSLIFKHAVLSLEESQSFSKTPYILQVPIKLRVLSTLRRVQSRWHKSLDIPKILTIADISTQDLAGWQCRYAGDKYKVDSTLEAQIKELQKQKQPALLENLNSIKNELNVSFIGMTHLLKQKILDPNMLVPVLVGEYFDISNKNIGIGKLASKEQRKKGTIVELPLLHYALRCDAHRNFIELLLHAGANVNHDIEHRYARTPLYVHMLYSQDPVKMLMLYALGANPNIQDTDGNTLLHSLAKNELFPSHVKPHITNDFLLAFGTDIDIPNNNSQTTRQLLGIEKQSFIIRCIQFAGNTFTNFMVAKIKEMYEIHHEEYELGNINFSRKD